MRALKLAHIITVDRSSVAKMDIEQQKEKILKKLKDAGQNGLSKSRLGKSKDMEAALNELQEDMVIGNLGTRKRVRYVLIEFYNPRERACEEIEMFTEVEPKGNEFVTFTLTKIRSKLTAGVIREKADEAIGFLVNERKLLKVRACGRVNFIHASTVKPYLGIFEEHTKNNSVDTDINRDTILESYEKIKRQKGFPNIEIYELQHDLSVPADKLKELLLEESRKGSAVLSMGDWSLSSDEVRNAAIDLDGKPHLLIRFL